MAKKKIRGAGEQKPPEQETTPGLAEELEKTESTSGEQLDLIDIGPENAKIILPVAKDYKKAVQARMRAGEKESELKQKLRELILKENLARLEDGTIRFHLDGMIITLKPREELITVKDEQDEAQGDE